MQDETIKKLHYKNGQCIEYAGHVSYLNWHREGVKEINKSRKEFTCALGCKIPKSSSYISLEMLQGSCDASCTDFALCLDHKLETEKTLGVKLSDIIEPCEIIAAWAKIKEDVS